MAHQCMECGWHSGEHQDTCSINSKSCRFCGHPKAKAHHSHCPRLAGAGEIKLWERGYQHGRIGKPRDGYGPHYNLGYLRGREALDAAVAAQPPGW